MLNRNEQPTQTPGEKSHEAFMRTRQVDPAVAPRKAPGPTTITCGLLALVLVLVLIVLPGASAHAGLTDPDAPRFTMPGWVVYLAGASVVAASFALVGAFLSREEEQKRLYRDGSAQARERKIDGALTPTRSIALAVLLVAAGNLLVPGSTSALPAVLLWVGLWVVLPVIAYTLGDPWPRLSPFALFLGPARLLRGGRAPRPYPVRLGLWPAVILLLLLIGVEVADHPWTQDARPLALGILAYMILTFLGVLRYGDAWLQNGEVIGRMLHWWGAVSPLRWERTRPRWRGLKGLHELSTPRVDAVAFTIALLYGVNHDVLLHTQAAQAITNRADSLGLPGDWLLLVAGYLLFLGIWLLASRAMRERAESLASVRATAALFVASLLPIAAVYHLAHNLHYLIETAPLVLHAVQDPFGSRNLVDATVSGEVSAGLLAPLAGLQVLLILGGHLLAVLVAHRLAFAAHPSRVQAVRAEIPLTLVMVVYTGIGLALLGAGGAA